MKPHLFFSLDVKQDVYLHILVLLWTSLDPSKMSFISEGARVSCSKETPTCSIKKGQQFLRGSTVGTMIICQVHLKLCDSAALNFFKTINIRTITYLSLWCKSINGYLHESYTSSMPHFLSTQMSSNHISPPKSWGLPAVWSGVRCTYGNLSVLDLRVFVCLLECFSGQLGGKSLRNDMLT